MAEHIPSETSTQNQIPVSLHKAKRDLCNLLQNIKIIEEKEKKLRESINSLSSNQWTAQLTEINLIKTNISTTLQQYEEHSTLVNLKKLFHRRTRKRERNKKLNIPLKSEKKNSTANRKQLHDIIDQRLENENQKNFKIKQTKEAAEHAEVVLSSVTAKKADAKRYIQLLSSLKKLRKALRIASQKNDLGENEFNSKINGLIAVWSDALDEYELEETNLKTILTDTHMSVDDQWNRVLFGITSKDNSKLLSFAEENFDKLLEIRYAWDSCIVPEENSSGSRIPTGWILPPENPSQKWSVYKK